MAIVYHDKVKSRVPASEFEDDDLVTKKYVDDHAGGGPGGPAEWGQITGTLSDQADLRAELGDLQNSVDALQTTLDVLAGKPSGALKFAANFVGDASKTEFPISHALGTSEISVSIRNIATNAVVLTDVSVADDDSITIGFALPPASGQWFHVTVLG